MKRGFTLTEAMIVVGVVSFFAWIILPPSIWHGGSARHNARRASCQSNLKQIGLALQQYAWDYDDQLPLRSWGRPVAAYTKSLPLFQCPETNATNGTSDYFFNARFVRAQLGLIKSPATLILFGDGQDDAPLDVTLTQLPTDWRTDESSPAYRHLDTANYLFADGHVKHLKANRVTKDFRMVTR